MNKQKEKNSWEKQSYWKELEKGLKEFGFNRRQIQAVGYYIHLIALDSIREETIGELWEESKAVYPCSGRECENYKSLTRINQKIAWAINKLKTKGGE